MIKIFNNYFSYNLTYPVKLMIKAIIAKTGFITGTIFRLLLNSFTASILFKIMKKQLKNFIPLFTNTINITQINTKNPANVTPDVILVNLDTRLLPGEKLDNILLLITDFLMKQLLYNHVPLTLVCTCLTRDLHLS